MFYSACVEVSLALYLSVKYLSAALCILSFSVPCIVRYLILIVYLLTCCLMFKFHVPASDSCFCFAHHHTMHFLAQLGSLVSNFHSCHLSVSVIIIHSVFQCNSVFFVVNVVLILCNFC